MDVEFDQQIVEIILAFTGACRGRRPSPLGASAAIAAQLDHPVADPRPVPGQRRRRRAPQHLS
jgi:Fe-S cluster biogenesis protein NfuA